MGENSRANRIASRGMIDGRPGEERAAA